MGSLLVLVPFGCVPGPAKMKTPFPLLTSHVSSLLLTEGVMGIAPYVLSANIMVSLCH